MLTPTGCKQAGLGNSKLLRMVQESKADERKEKEKLDRPNPASLAVGCRFY